MLSAIGAISSGVNLPKVATSLVVVDGIDGAVSAAGLALSIFTGGLPIRGAAGVSDAESGPADALCTAVTGVVTGTLPSGVTTGAGLRMPTSVAATSPARKAPAIGMTGFIVRHRG
jgi:hypothetical protein